MHGFLFVVKKNYVSWTHDSFNIQLSYITTMSIEKANCRDCMVKINLTLALALRLLTCIRLSKMVWFCKTVLGCWHTSMCPWFISYLNTCWFVSQTTAELLELRSDLNSTRSELKASDSDLHDSLTAVNTTLATKVS